MALRLCAYSVDSLCCATINSDKTESEGTELMAFYGRERELTLMNRLFNRAGQGVALVYGRRRVGKSELVKQSLHSFDGASIYYECKQTTESNNVESLAALVSDLFGYPSLSFRSMEDVIGFLFEKSVEAPIVLVLDEYPYLRDAVKGLDSIIQSLVDRYHETSLLKLVLCGSYIEVMKSLLEEGNPLFGRVDVTIRLKPMDYYDAAKFYPDFSHEDKVRLYSVFGGIPYYNKLVDSSLTVDQNLMELVTEPDARLQGEVGMFLKSEISKITNANEVFEALARGYSRYKELLDQSHVSSGPAMVDVLKRLVGMELVEKRIPINDPGNARKTSYAISDGLSRFYYRYISRYLSQISVMEPKAFYERYVAGDFEEQYVPHAFEDICGQFLIRKNREGRLEEPFDLIGRYSYNDPKARKNGEFDVVTKDPEGYVFYEAKFRKTPVTDRMIEEEIAQVEATGLRCCRYGFFSRSGFACKPRENVALYDLNDLYDLYE